MNITFSIDALSPAADKAWRLQQDDTWRECTYAEPLQTNDARITDKHTAEHWAGRRMQKDNDLGLIAKDKAGMFDFLMRGTFAHAVLHRLSAAPIPDKKQMIQATAALAPGTAWLIYLNTAAQFKAIDANHSKIIGNLDIAVRGEIASSADYIGEKSSLNEALMQNTYLQFLGGWLEHLNTSNMGIFIPDVEKLKEESEYTNIIQNWQPESESNA
ncbi:MAG: hypothetical protein Q9M14_07770 [Mariprofundaceae bacterium]|nr:hypothetical protein [Mariprofundaceae bacterium]